MTSSPTRAIPRRTTGRDDLLSDEGDAETDDLDDLLSDEGDAETDD